MVHCSIFDNEYLAFLLYEDGRNLLTMNPAKFSVENILSGLFVAIGTNFMVIKSQAIYIFCIF